jgi:hypothetical protein
VSSSIDFSGLERLKAKLDRIGGADFEPLMETWAQDVLLKNHEARIAAGLDVDEKPMPPTWREQHAESQWVTIGKGPGRRRFKMEGSQDAGGGPPLAPKDSGSRVLRNARARGFKAGDVYEARLYWEDVEAPNGKSILAMHASPGAGARYPKRDVCSHASPTDRREAKDELRAYVRYLVKGG